MGVPDKLPKERKDEIISDLQNYFEAERGEQIGHLAAEALLDFMVAELAPHIYNKAIEDSRQVMLQLTSRVDDELYALSVPTIGRRK